ncbi:MAG: porin [Paracoccaceae bacterium]
MKKLLLASTALVGFAGAAAAEVTLSGYAEIGIFGGEAIETQFHSDLDVTFNLSGESDNGLSFGATIDLDEVGDDCTRGVISTTGTGTTAVTTTACVGGDPISHTGRGSGTEEHSVWVSGVFGKVTLGDTDGAYDWALSEVYMGTSLTDDHSTHAGAYWFTGLDGTYDGQVMRYEYSFGDFAAGISAEIDDSGVGSAALGIGVKWSGDMGGTAVNAGLGYQTVDLGAANGDASEWGVSAGADLAGGFSVKAGYADRDNPTGTADWNWWGVGVGYSMDALTVQANYGAYDVSGVANDPSGWGLVVNYDLGGGAVAMLGYGASDNGVSFNGGGDNTFSAGLGLSF